jgi:hypothetical protein
MIEMISILYLNSKHLSITQNYFELGKSDQLKEKSKRQKANDTEKTKALPLKVAICPI